MRPDGPGWPTASTRPVALLGWPVRHSLSPSMHNAAFREQGLDLVYVALPVPPDHLLRSVAALGDAEAVGANVTIPHKEAVIAACDAVTDEAALVGAVNTLAWTADGLLGDNTDATGFGTVLRDDVRLRSGDPAVILGTGGAARAGVVALARAGAEVTVVGRRAATAESLAELAEAAGATAADAVDLADETWTQRVVEAARLVVNATPLGMDGERLPAPFHRLGSGQVAYDMVYRPAETPFLVDARAAGAETHHGLGMLVAQAAGAYRRWTGREAPLATMSAVATAALTVRR